MKRNMTAYTLWSSHRAIPGFCSWRLVVKKTLKRHLLGMMLFLLACWYTHHGLPLSIDKTPWVSNFPSGMIVIQELTNRGAQGWLSLKKQITTTSSAGRTLMTPATRPDARQLGSHTVHSPYDNYHQSIVMPQPDAMSARAGHAQLPIPRPPMEVLHGRAPIFTLTQVTIFMFGIS